MICFVGNSGVKYLLSVNICEQVINELCIINSQALIKIHEKFRLKKQKIIYSVWEEHVVE